MVLPRLFFKLKKWLSVLVVAMTLLLGAVNVWAWSADGHGDIALAALEKLPEKTRKEYQRVLMVGPWAKGDIDWKIAATRAAAWPDTLRNMALRRVFGQYGSGDVPPALQKYRKGSTTDWHYMNAVFIDQKRNIVDGVANADGKTCPPKRAGKLVDVWPDLLTAYKQVKDDRDKAIVLAFILHMVADAYQPLHMMGSMDSECQHDRGGNAFCLSPVVGFKAGQRCGTNLHSQWDKGYGAFSEHLEVKGTFRGNLKKLEPAVKEARALAVEIYPKDLTYTRSKEYKKKARQKISRQSQKSAQHLVATLEFLAK